MKDKFVAQRWDGEDGRWVDIISVDHDNPHSENIVINVAKTFKMDNPKLRVRTAMRYVSHVEVEELD